jgi:hypothetical protein
MQSNVPVVRPRVDLMAQVLTAAVGWNLGSGAYVGHSEHAWLIQNPSISQI